jgi:hypothetical protein
MKKFAYLLTVVLAITLMSFSCEKEDPIVEDQITVQDLLGDWNFVSLEFNGTVYDTEAELWTLNETYDLVGLSLLDVTTATATLNDPYFDNNDGVWEAEYNYTLNDLVINFEDQIELQILNAETFNGTVLKLKLIDCVKSDTPINGIYTLER